MTLLEILRRIARPATPVATVHAPPPAPGSRATDEESLGCELLRLDWGLGLFRWVHLSDAVERAGHISTAISFGSGEGLHEAFLARARGNLAVLGVDLRTSELVDP
ncbi:MAG TPA: hypothetical protein VMN04_07345, partial [Thermoanaerobaculia bacterium]|nr:hypothetical protein [Thermoanaerobaculia bacterium]